MNDMIAYEVAVGIEWQEIGIYSMAWGKDMYWKNSVLHITSQLSLIMCLPLLSEIYIIWHDEVMLIKFLNKIKTFISEHILEKHNIKLLPGRPAAISTAKHQYKPTPEP